MSTSTNTNTSKAHLFDQMAGLNGALRQKMERAGGGWEHSPFAWIRQQPSRRVGAIGEAFARALLAADGFTMDKAQSSEHDMRADGKRLEVKFSTQWETGRYKFQQIRDQAYDGALLLGLSPQTAHAWFVPKLVLMAAWKAGHLVGQHGGSGAKETAWIEVDPGNVPAWLAPYGPTLDVALQHLRALQVD